jgi:hypothetical protein
MPLKSDPAQSVAFLTWWRPAGPWVLTAISNDRTRDTVTETFRPGDEDRMAAWIARMNDEQGRNVYFHVNRTLRLLSKKAEKTDMASMDWLHVDIDPRPGKDIDAERARILAMLGAHEGLPPPSAVIFSGGGYQGFWRLKDSLPIDGDVTKAEDAERYNLQVELLLGADACHNVDRIMRLPGTVNWPSDKKKAKGQKPALAIVLGQHDDHVYPASVFTKAAQREDDLPDAGGGTAATRVKVSGNVRRVSLDELPAELNDRIKVIIQQGRDDDQPLTGKDQSRSAWLLHAVGAMVRTKKIDDDTIYAIITDPEFAISASVLDKGNSAQVDRYAKRQIKRAKEEAIAPELVEFNDAYAVVESVGGRCRIAKESFDEGLGRRMVEFLLVDGFKLTHCNRFVMVSAGKDANGNDKLRAVPLGEWWLHHPERRTYSSVMFYPGKDAGKSMNLWRGFAFDAIPGDCTLFLDHLRKVLCRGNDAHYQYLVGWMAYRVQFPHMPGQVAIVLRGKQGTGKGTFARHLGKLFGGHYKHVTNPDHITGKFNTVLHDAVLVFADECFRTDKAHASALKALITEETLRVEAKGVDNLESRNCMGFILATNQDQAILAALDDRRYFALDVPDDRRRDSEYFSAMERQMEAGGYSALLHYLLTYDLSTFDVRAVPRTEELKRQQKQSMGPAESFWFQCLEEGRLSPTHDAWTGEVVADEFADRFLAGYGRHMTPHQAKTILGIFLARVAAGFARTRLRKLVEWTDSHGKTVRHNSPSAWRFASLDRCRAAWDKEFTPQDWPDIDEGDEAPPPVDPAGPF